MGTERDPRVGSAIEPGSEFGPYRVDSRIGAGGMGEVFRATDTRLGRSVALKFSREHFSDRFEQEARAIARLNHPNICTLHDVGPNYLVMELVEGETLADRLRRGPLSPSELRAVAIQMASALAAAHAKGITHRDLKPANIMLTKSGVKVLDFGLAKLSQPNVGSVLAETVTQEIVGTPGYMAPEQLEGKPADARTDLFAFGLILYEMAAGKRVINGESVAECVRQTLNDESPPMAELPKSLARVIAVCLKRDPDERWQSAADVGIALKWEDAEAPGTPVVRRGKMPWLVGGLIAAAAIGFLIFRLRPAVPADQPFLQFEIDAGSENVSQLAISADGKRVAAVTPAGISIRRLDQQAGATLPGTEGAVMPFFSPDGKWVAFFAHGQLLKLAVDGGTPIVLCNALFPTGGDWAGDDRIVAGFSDALHIIPAGGGSAQRILAADPAVGVPSNPRWLPGEKSVLYAAIDGSSQGSVHAVHLADGKIKKLVDRSIKAVYVPGHIIYAQQDGLYAAPLNEERLELTGPAMPLSSAIQRVSGRPDFDGSRSGSVVYRRGLDFVLSWVDTSGNIEPVVKTPGIYISPTLSPDGTRVAVAIVREGKQNLWVYELNRETWTRLTFDDEPVMLPVWSGDSEYIVFRSGSALKWTRSDGRGGVDRMQGVSPNSGPYSFSPDGKLLAFWPLQSDSDMMFLAPVIRTADKLSFGPARELLREARGTGAPAISGDGRWLAYTSYQSGRFEIYLTPFDAQGKTGRRWVVSNAGGLAPKWASKSNDLFYKTPDRHVEVVKVGAEGLGQERPRRFSDLQVGDTLLDTAFDPTADGRRILAQLPAGSRSSSLVHIMLNVDGELRRKRMTAR